MGMGDNKPDWTGYTPFSSSFGNEMNTDPISGGLDLSSPMSTSFGGVADSLPGGLTPANFNIGAPGGGLFGHGGALGTGENGFQLGGDILGGLKTLGGLYLGIRQLGLANKQFKFSKAFANANLANQTQSYNTALSDRATARYSQEGLSPAQAQSYIAANSLKSVNLGG